MGFSACFELWCVVIVGVAFLVIILAMVLLGTPKNLYRTIGRDVGGFGNTVAYDTAWPMNLIRTTLIMGLYQAILGPVLVADSLFSDNLITRSASGDWLLDPNKFSLTHSTISPSLAVMLSASLVSPSYSFLPSNTITHGFLGKSWNNFPPPIFQERKRYLTQDHVFEIERRDRPSIYTGRRPAAL